MSIKSLVKEYVRIEEAERKLHERKYALKDKTKQNRADVLKLLMVLFGKIGVESWKIIP
jgi:hypothetical protein